MQTEIKTPGYPIDTTAYLTLYERVKKDFKNKKITAGTLSSIALHLVVAAERYNSHEKYEGKVKKELVISLIGNLIEESYKDKTSEEYLNVYNLSQLALPGIIDAYVSIDRKDVQIALKKMCWCFNCD